MKSLPPWLVSLCAICFLAPFMLDDWGWMMVVWILLALAVFRWILRDISDV